MTDDIDTMSGPELSAAVAEEIMGWALNRFETKWFNENAEFIMRLESWQPHSDRNDAHRVLERCEELRIASRTETILKSDVRYRGSFVWTMLTIDPAIICRAALRAVREAK